jgi:hypothetical protein
MRPDPGRIIEAADPTVAEEVMEEAAGEDMVAAGAAGQVEEDSGDIKVKL